MLSMNPFYMKTPILNDPHGKGSEKLEGRYANYFEIGHNEFEFIIDFGQSYQDEKDIRMHTRIITSPAYLRTLLDVLSKSTEEYERTFGIGCADKVY